MYFCASSAKFVSEKVNQFCSLTLFQILRSCSGMSRTNPRNFSLSLLSFDLLRGVLFLHLWGLDGCSSVELLAPTRIRHITFVNIWHLSRGLDICLQLKGICFSRAGKNDRYAQNTLGGYLWSIINVRSALVKQPHEGCCGEALCLRV